MVFWSIETCLVQSSRSFFFVFFFFFKQKTAYEILAWLEFRRVLFRSHKASYLASPSYFLRTSQIKHTHPLSASHFFTHLRCSATKTSYISNSQILPLFLNFKNVTPWIALPVHLRAAGDWGPFCFLWLQRMLWSRWFYSRMPLLKPTTGLGLGLAFA